MALGDSMRKAILGFPSQFKAGLELAEGISFQGVDSSVTVGMGGSALQADLLNCWIPELGMRVQRTYSCPPVGPKTLLFASSYSGNTEETISAMEDGLKHKAKTVALASGAKLEKLALEKKIPFVKIPSGVQPRCANGFTFAATARILEESGLITGKTDEIRKLKIIESESEGRKFAARLKDRIPVVYASDAWWQVARSCKIKFNENSKVPCFWNVFPELNHNEMVGFTRPLTKFHVIFLRDDEDHPRVQERMEITRGLFERKGLECSEIPMRGKTRLEKMFNTLYFFDWASFQLALEYGVDPEPVEMVEDLKKALK